MSYIPTSETLPATQHSPHCPHCGHDLGSDALFCPNCGTARSRDLSGDPLMGTVVGDRFLILERLGHGGSGTIYRAEHVTLRRKVAVKVLHHELSRDDLAVERFRREATTVSEIDNDHIVEIHDFGRTHDGRLYLAMELLEGETLLDVIQREQRLGVERAVDVLMQLGEALSEAHAMGYVHRDLRPRNIWLSRRRGRDDFVKLLDFGLAKLVAHEGLAASTSLGMTFGDPKYMSPEQARGEALDRRADIYSMGCIAYEMLVGEPPFAGGKVFDILTQHIDTAPSPPRERRGDVPAWLSDVVMRMLAKKPHDRFVTVMGLVEALHQRTDSPVLPAESEPDSGGEATAAGRDDDRGEARRPRARTSTALYGQPADGRPDDPDDRDDNDGRDDHGRRDGRRAAPARAESPRGGAIAPRSGRSAGTSPGMPVASPEPAREEPAGSSDLDDAGRAPSSRGRRPSTADDDRRPATADRARRATTADGDRTAKAEDGQPGRSASDAVTPLRLGAVSAASGRSPTAPERSDDRRDEARADSASARADSASTRADSASTRARKGARAAASAETDAGDPSSLSGSGLSGDWFAAAEGDLDESGRQRLDDARTLIDADDTSSIHSDELFPSGRRPLVRIAAVLGAGAMLVLLVILLWPTSAPPGSVAATVPDAAAPTSAAAEILANLNADAAAPAAPAVTATPPDAGATVAAATEPAPPPETAPPPTPAPSAATRSPTPSRSRPASRTTRAAHAEDPTRTRSRPTTPARSRSGDGDKAADSPSSENAKQALFFSKMGEQALRSGNILEAARHFKKALELDPKNADAVMGQGEIAYRQGSYSNAIARLEKAVRMRPRSARAHTLLGEAYLGAGNNAKAAASFKRALKIRPGDARAQRGYTEATGQPPPS
ncbi:protein kinase domain-containing protein [Haliangium sp.]|uniref:protein kinase domain-containing protein n=1 Tax=Haliangium sp. TaxID=2663208 RepID=UPI003D0C6D0B